MGKILFLGNCCFDIVYYVDGYPAEDSDNRHILQINTLGGNVVNSMKICAQLDCRSQLFTALPEGNPVFDSLLQEYRIDASRCIRRNSKAEFPLTCVIVNSLTGSRTMFNSSKGIDWPTAQEFSQKFPNFDDFTWAHFETRTSNLLHHNWQHCKTSRRILHWYRWDCHSRINALLSGRRSGLFHNEWTRLPWP
ncbi:ketohexokinase [Ditylenchus destructor]|uniref:Ketohexokinase n=1 Tax=Ditylenchus destructor TaxID=166010 RepID=A0AAD4R4W8_9BILA|nr:ketohexokinase [Ditylenchus destructor]